MGGIFFLPSSAISLTLTLFWGFIGNGCEIVLNILSVSTTLNYMIFIPRFINIFSINSQLPYFI